MPVQLALIVFRNVTFSFKYHPQTYSFIILKGDIKNQSGSVWDRLSKFIKEQNQKGSPIEEMCLLQ